MRALMLLIVLAAVGCANQPADPQTILSTAQAPVSSSAAAKATPRSGESVSIDKLLPSKYGYSNVAVTDGRLAFIAGQIAEDEHGTFVGRDDFEAQTRQVFLNLKTILGHLNASPDDVVKLNYYIVGVAPDRLAAVRAARDAMFVPP